MKMKKNKKFIDPRYFMNEKTDIIKEEIESALSEGREELKAIAANVKKMQEDSGIMDDPQMQDAFKKKYARHVNQALGKDLADPFGMGWVENVMMGGF